MSSQHDYNIESIKKQQQNILDKNVLLIYNVKEKGGDPVIKMRLKEIRESKDIAQWEVGAIIRLDQAAISRIENGKQDMTLPDAVTLAEYFGVLITDLYEVVKNAG
jgi:DNA-binding XRE family transcriptional regulator